MIELAAIAVAGVVIAAAEEYVERRRRGIRWAAIPSPHQNRDRVAAYYARLAARHDHPEDPPFIPRLRRGVNLQTELALRGRMNPTT